MNCHMVLRAVFRRKTINGLTPINFTQNLTSLSDVVDVLPSVVLPGGSSFRSQAVTALRRVPRNTTTSTGPRRPSAAFDRASRGRRRLGLVVTRTSAPPRTCQPSLRPRQVRDDARPTICPAGPSGGDDRECALPCCLPTTYCNAIIGNIEKTENIEPRVCDPMI